MKRQILHEKCWFFLLAPLMATLRFFVGLCYGFLFVVVVVGRFHIVVFCRIRIQVFGWLVS